MPSNVQDLPAKEVNVLNKYTGFPEPLSSDRNTTLPHPDADISPNATIEAADFDLTRTSSRNSFLHRRNQSKNNFGKIIMKDSGLYDKGYHADSTQELRNTRSLDFKPPECESARNGVSEENGAVSRSGDKSSEKGHINGVRKNGVLRKLNLLA